MKLALRLPHVEARPWMFIALAVVFAAAAGYVVYDSVRSLEDRGSAPPVVTTVQIVVAAVDVPARTALGAEHVVLRAYPSDLVPSGAFTDTRAVLGRRVMSAVAQGQPLTPGALTTIESGEGAAIAIPQGKVLLAFPASDALTSAGLVRAHDHVDLLVTLQLTTSGVTQVTLQDLEVMEVLGPTEDQPQRAASLVFIVDPQSALVLTHLRDSRAPVQLVLRAVGDRASVGTTGVDDEFIAKNYLFKR